MMVEFSKKCRMAQRKQSAITLGKMQIVGECAPTTARTNV